MRLTNIDNRGEGRETVRTLPALSNYAKARIMPGSHCLRGNTLSLTLSHSFSLTHPLTHYLSLSLSLVLVAL